MLLVAECGEAWDFPATFRHKDGHPYLVKISITRFEAGGHRFLTFAVRDVTALRAAEEFRNEVEAQLREREKRFIKIFDLVPEAVSITRMDGDFLVDVNSNWEYLTGYTRAECIGKRAVEDLGLWANPKRRAELIQRLEGEAYVRDFDAEFRKRDGTIAAVHAYCSVFESDGRRYLLTALQDVTELRNSEQARRRAELNLRESERQLRAVLNAMGEGIIVRDAQGRRVLSNAAADEIYGVTEIDPQAINDLEDVCFTFEDGERVRTEDLPLWKTLSTGISERNVLMGLRRKDGTQRWLYVSTDPIFSEEHPGRPVQVVSALVDVSRQRDAEARLREREAVLTTVFQLVPDTLTITRLHDGQYIDVNRNWDPLCGYTRDEAVGRTSRDLNLWVDPAQRVQMVERIQRDGEVRGMQVAFRHRDGRVLQCRVSGSQFESAGETYLLLSVRNIDAELAAENARQAAERLLRENEYKYATIFQLSPIPLGLVSMDNAKIVEVNEIWQSQFGYRREEVVGHTALEMAFWESPEERMRMEDELKANDRLDRLEIKHRHKDGHFLTCLMSARLFDMDKGRMFIFALLDMTRQYEIEREIREMTMQLEDRVRQRTLNLEQANQELAAAMQSLKHTQGELIRSEKMAALGSLVAGVAHELNTPIGNSVTVASTLEDKTRELLREMNSGTLRRSSLDQYLQSAATGTALLMRTLNVARELIRSFKQVAVDQSSSQRRRFDLQKALEEVMATLAPMYKKGPYTLVADLSPGIQMDSFPGPLGQIVTNFMTNALAHAFEGRSAGCMTLSCRLVDESHAEVSFADDGIGIAEVDQKRVFDPFFTTKLGRGGSGLGMNIAYNLVTGVLGGEIRLESKLGTGTRFTMLLPLNAPQMSGEAAGSGVDELGRERTG
jgi:PAS domain S-box-containing protein